MRVLVTAPRSELGHVLMRARGGDDSEGAAVIVNLALQAPNTLLHDGHAWWPDPRRHILGSTRRVLAAAKRENAAVVHASYAFLQGAEGGSTIGERMRPIVDAAQEAEEIVLRSGVPASVVRLGYLYGPTWKDLRAYRRAFRLGRPYWAGPARVLHHHLHAADAARALLAAARRRPAAQRTYATDGTPASFSDFMDHFARLVGRDRPLHLPRASRLLVSLVVHEEHVQMVDLAASGPATPALPRWRPSFPSYREGLAEVIEAWRSTA